MPVDHDSQVIERAKDFFLLPASFRTCAYFEQGAKEFIYCNVDTHHSNRALAFAYGFPVRLAPVKSCAFCPRDCAFEEHRA